MQKNVPQSIVLVTPVWNDSDRLAVFGPALARALAEAELPIRWIIADDGSDEDEANRYHALREDLARIYSDVDVLCCGSRSRKGGAVYDAWNHANRADY